MSYTKGHGAMTWEGWEGGGADFRSPEVGISAHADPYKWIKMI